MSNKFKDIDIKNHPYYFSNVIIIVINFDPNKVKIDEKSYKNIFIYYIGYVAITDWKYLKINSVNFWYLIINKVNEYFEGYPYTLNGYHRRVLTANLLHTGTPKPPNLLGLICDPNKSRAWHHRSLKLGWKLKYLNVLIMFSMLGMHLQLTLMLFLLNSF